MDEPKPGRVRRAWLFMRWLIAPEIGIMDILLVLLIVTCSLPEMILMPSFGFKTLAQFACIALMANVRGRELAMRQIPEIASRMCNAILAQMEKDGIIRFQGPPEVKPEKGVH